MPRVNPLRSLANERNVAERVRYEREKRGMSYEGLAKRLANAGCPMQATAIFKIEKGAPPRRITVDELVGFATVFEIDIAEMTEPMPGVLDRKALEITGHLGDALMRFADAVNDLVLRQIELTRLAESHHDADADVLNRAYAHLPSLSISYPLGAAGRAPDPVRDAWHAMDEGIAQYAEWFVENRSATR